MDFILFLGFLAFITVDADEETLIHVAKVGDRTVLPCYYAQSNGNPIRWFKGNLMLSFGKNVFRDKAKFEIESPVATETNLVIMAVEQTDEGIYRCKTTANGEDIIIGERRLKVETKPEIDHHASSPIYIDVQEGQTVRIWCNVSGTPEPTVTWKRYLGRDFAPPTDIGVTGNTLTIPSITKYATDRYVCHVANRHGELSREITVNVSFPVKANLYRSEIFANPGEDVFMACMVEGNPIIDAYWKDVHGRKVATNWQFEVNTESRVGGYPLRLLELKIRSQAFSDREFGYYTCYVAGNSPDEDTATVHLRRAEETPDNRIINYQ